MKPQVKVEFLTSSKNKKIAGILAIPRISRNGNLYLPEELAKAHGRTVPMLWNHEGSPKSTTDPVNQSNIIGSMRLFWDPDLMQLKYEAEVDRDLPDTPLYTSLGAFFEKEDHVCGSNQCYSIPRGLRFIEASLTPTPGIPETMVKIIENFECKQCRVSSLTSEASKQCTMSSSETEACITGKQFQEGVRSIVDAIGEHFKSAQQAQLEKLSEIIPKPAPSSMIDDSARKATKESHDRKRGQVVGKRRRHDEKERALGLILFLSVCSLLFHMEDYKALYEQAVKDRAELLEKYNELVEAYGTLKRSVQASVIKAVGGLAGDMTAIGFYSANYDKLE